MTNNRLNQLAADYEYYEDSMDHGDDLLSSANLADIDSSDIQTVTSRLRYYFMDPMKKWKRRNTRPWKLLVQILKIVAFTWHLLLFGSDMARFITYKDEMQTTLKQLLLKDWDPSNDGMPYPGPYVPYAVYTKSEFFHTMNYAIRTYSKISSVSVGPFAYQSNATDVVSPIKICSTSYVQADFQPDTLKYNYSLYTYTQCNTIENYAPAGSNEWDNFDVLKNGTLPPFNFSTLLSSSVVLPLRTLIIEDASSGDSGVACFNVDIDILFDNKHRDGQIAVSLTSLPKRAKCDGQLTEIREDFLSRRILNLIVMFFCMLSFSLCTRSLWRGYNLLKTTERVLGHHGRKLDWEDRLEFLDTWLLIIIINDLMIVSATVIIAFYDQRLLESSNYTVCSLLLGVGNFLSWSGLLRYLSFFKKYNLLIVTLRKSFAHVMRFMLCTMLIYCGFCFCGWVVFGPYHAKFRELSTTTECLFALINGDDMFETFALLRSQTNAIWWFSRIYLYMFVSLFIYVVLSLFIALIMDAYEIIKQYSDNGFPKTKLQTFYKDGDLSKLPLIT